MCADAKQLDLVDHLASLAPGIGTRITGTFPHYWRKKTLP
jgi:hypothetical protein